MIRRLSDGTSGYSDYLNRYRPRRLGFGARPTREVHPAWALALVYGVFLGASAAAAIIRPVTNAAFLLIFR
jgi:hypothetical protein